MNAAAQCCPYPLRVTNELPLPRRSAVLSPRGASRLELARAIGVGLASPLRWLVHAPGRSAEMRRIAGEVEASDGRIDPVPALELPTDRPLRVFLSAAEASGEIHGANLVEALRRVAARHGAPVPEITAIGGERLRALDVPTIGDPVARAHMGFDGVLQSLPYYAGLLADGASHARDRAPDVLVPIDSPALHVPLARMVRRYGVPVVHLVTPQYWGWAPWRVHAYRRAIDLGLTILPHEARWFARHGVRTKHVGHPLLDALEEIPRTSPPEDSNVLAVLPGSRAGVIRRNLPWMMRALSVLRAEHPNARIEILQATGEHVGSIVDLTRDEDVRVVVGDLHSSLARARAAFAVSGTILTDVLHHRLPVVVIYRVSKRMETWMRDHVLIAPYFASTNLLAGEAIVPEHCFRGEGPLDVVAGQVRDAYSDEATRSRMAAGFERALERLGPPGAIERTAHHALALAADRARQHP